MTQPSAQEIQERALQKAYEHGWTPELEAKRRAEHPEFYVDDPKFDGWVPLSQRYPHLSGLLLPGETWNGQS